MDTDDRDVLRVLVVRRPMPKTAELSAWTIAELLRLNGAQAVAIAPTIGARRIVNESGWVLLAEPLAMQEQRLGLVFGRAVSHQIGHHLLPPRLQRHILPGGRCLTSLIPHTETDFVTWGGAAAQFLAQNFANICSGVTDLPSDTGAAARQWVVRMWANVLEPGAMNRLHYHPGAFWSGVYYVTDGREVQDQEVGGDLILHSPHEGISSMYAPDVRIKLPNGQPLLPTFAIRPRPGLGVIFPSWLMHEVDPYCGNQVRISVAFNFSLTSGANPTRERASPG